MMTMFTIFQNKGIPLRQEMSKPPVRRVSVLRCACDLQLNKVDFSLARNGLGMVLQRRRPVLSVVRAPAVTIKLELGSGPQPLEFVNPESLCSHIL